jgi:tetratricopeptide (TPR) repeat protein
MAEKNTKGQSLDNILQTINSAENVINEVKASGIEIPESERLLEQAMHAYREKDDRKVMFFVKKAEALAKKIWKDYYVKLTDETLSSTRKLIDEVKEANLDPKEAEELFNHAITLVEQKNFKLAEEYIKKAVTSANMTWNTSRAKVVSDSIASIHALIMEAKDIGVDVSEAEKILLNAITHYKNEEYETADELVKNAVILARNSWNSYRAKVASEGISEAYNLILKAKNSGADITKAEKILNEAEMQFEENEYEDVERLLKLVDDYVKDQIQESHHDVTLKLLQEVENSINEAKSMKADVTSAEELFKQAKVMFEEKDYDSVEDYLKVIETLVNDSRQQRENELAAESISSTESLLRDIETKVGDQTTNDALLATHSLLEKLKMMGETDETTVGELSDELPVEPKVLEPAVQEAAADDSEVYEWGATFISKEPKSQKSFNFYLDLINGGAKGLCISRMHPDKLATKYNLKDSTIWLSKLPCETCRNPSNLGKLAFTINQFLDRNPQSVIILDGLEYLISNNDFQMVLRFIDDIHESIVVHDSIFVIPVSTASYNERELTLLERNTSALTGAIIKNIHKFFINLPEPKVAKAASKAAGRTDKGSKPGKPSKPPGKRKVDKAKKPQKKT